MANLAPTEQELLLKVHDKVSQILERFGETRDEDCLDYDHPDRSASLFRHADGEIEVKISDPANLSITSSGKTDDPTSCRCLSNVLRRLDTLESTLSSTS